MPRLSTIGAAATAVGYEVDGCELAIVDGRVVPTGGDSTPASLEVLDTAPAHLISITADVCEAPVALWAGVDPPGDLEYVASILLGDDSPSNVARISRGNAVMAVFTKEKGRCPTPARPTGATASASIRPSNRSLPT